jgi:transcriptional regulator with PAS, ATPase and Fis domain
MRKKLGLITREVFTYNVLCKQLKDIFGDSIAIEGFSLEKDYDPKCELDMEVILFSGKATLDYVKKKEILPSDTRVILVERTLNINSIESIKELLELKPGTKVYIANNTYESDIRVIEMLKQFNIRNLEFIPYYPGSDNYTGEVDIAVIFGFPHLAPKHVNRVIDLGLRQIDLKTVFEIIEALKLDYRSANISTNDFVKPYINIINDLVASSNKIIEINKLLEGILNISKEGFIVLDANKRIIMANRNILDLLKIKNEEIIKKSIYEFIPVSKEEFKDIEDDNIRLIKLGNNKYLISISYLDKNNSQLGYIIVFRETSKIQNMEINLRQHLYLKEHKAKYTFNHIISRSGKVKELVNFAKQVACSDHSIILYGESGTGKELFAHAIHNNSNRAKQPFVAANVAALADNLIESELFGYVEGAFTGAKKEGKPGLFELAHKGTIFLDEIGDLSLTLQSKLLRVIQEKEVTRVGSIKVIPIDIRIIAATNKELWNMVQNGKFRQDLYFRLNVLPINLPPLRKRKEDIELLLKYFLEANGLSLNDVPDNIIHLLLEYDWPGNIRELENMSNYMACILKMGKLTKQATYKYILNYFSTKNNGLDGFNTQDNIKNYKEIIRELEKAADLQEFILILNEMTKALYQDRNISRKELCESLSPELTISKIRNRVELLSDLDLVASGRTKQGTRITQKGICFLRYITKSNAY